jgi:hypothetical protein
MLLTSRAVSENGISAKQAHENSYIRDGVPLKSEFFIFGLGREGTG